MSLQLAVFGLPGGMEWIFIGVVSLLVFGRRLPDVARSVGKSIVEFKRGLRDAKSEMDLAETHDQQSLPGNSERPTLEARAGDNALQPPAAADPTPKPKSDSPPVSSETERAGDS